MNINGYFSLVISIFSSYVFPGERKTLLQSEVPVAWHKLADDSVLITVYTSMVLICKHYIHRHLRVKTGLYRGRAKRYKTSKKHGIYTAKRMQFGIIYLAQFLVYRVQLSDFRRTIYRNANSWEVGTMVSRKTNPAISPVINPNDHLHLVSNTSRKKCLVIIGFTCVECLEL